MAIALRAVGTIVHGTTNAAPAYPAGIVAGDAVFLGAAWKLETATAPTLTGWTKVVDQAVGAGAAGAGTGAQRVVVYRKDTVAGGETGTVTVTPVESVNVVSGCIIAFSKTEATWDIAYDWGTDVAAGTNLSAPSQAQIAQTANDLLAGFIATTANSNMGSSTFTTPGVTYGSAVEHADAGTTNGNDQRVAWVSRPVTAGPESGVTTFTSNITATVTGGLGFVRLREAAGGPTTYEAAGTTAASTTATGSTSARLVAAGVVAATALTTGAATARLSASGETVATSATSGSATVLRPASGSVAATSGSSGTASARLIAAGAIAATTTTTGSASVIGGPVAHPAAGLVAVVSATTGAVTLRVATSGTTSAVSDTAGSTSALYVVGGTVAATSDATGEATNTGPATEPRDVAVVSIVAHPPRTVAITDASRQTVVTTAPARELAVVEHPRPVTIEES